MIRLGIGLVVAPKNEDNWETELKQSYIFQRFYGRMFLFFFFFDKKLLWKNVKSTQDFI